MPEEVEETPSVEQLCSKLGQKSLAQQDCKQASKCVVCVCVLAVCALCFVVSVLCVCCVSAEPKEVLIQAPQAKQKTSTQSVKAVTLSVKLAAQTPQSAMSGNSIFVTLSIVPLSMLQPGTESVSVLVCVSTQQLAA